MPDLDFTMLPNFFILGAAKAGTTSLFELLNQHPRVYLPFNKEPMFFSHDDNFKRGISWYIATYFRRAGTFPARGEATPHYLYWSEKVAARIGHLYAGSPVKFIIMLRDPVSRAYSWYWNMVKEGRENLPFHDALLLEDERIKANWETLHYTGSMVYGYLRGSRYATALAPYLALFPPENFLYILQDDLEKEFPQISNKLQQFIGLDLSTVLKPVTSNQATQPRNKHVQAWLRKQTPLRGVLISFLPMRFRYAIKTRLLQINARLAQYPKMDPGLESELRKKLAPEVLKLSQIIQRDLSNWLPQ